ncbi:MAG: hypothetical protein JGK17_29900 [Microcoleus sp. PH2017_10_PVI_O_A]|uniref:hypothetical protein n=1 Tax=unclassified Microcoleus TaxID=2642155 RepID=UPI001DA89D8D|nr:MULTISPECIES: hypothetical protein [unclassified Microcoleus]MCC3409691.1 hypothetical protein [Microcoleus sp. PH2017_10_PVI_O_A]MCC3463956.1 hypothetical protein [Microcoleus sp. PH2017_11_PCY_U_A]MCC3482281.1 hypothetical protein [Microcoleus sp. PH2017_12_PCY_D_A]MCC3563261.1 hypothetical protein [Microcoleus sp. PH2017_27_LUM_O_A]
MPEFTDGFNFVIDDDGKLYASQTSAIVRAHTVDANTQKKFSVPGKPTRTTFYLAKSDHKYFKDCLETAEDLINNQYPLSIPGTVRSKVKRINQNFGNSQADNIQATTEYKRLYPNYADEKADPVQGEAYVIVSLSEKTVYPYHAGAVIATDNTSQLTLEVFATDQNAKKRTETGTYHIYYLADSSKGKTFHTTWKDNSHLVSPDGVKPITIVIVKK